MNAPIPPDAVAVASLPVFAIVASPSNPRKRFDDAYIVATNKAGSLTMKIDLKPSTAGALAVKASVAIKKPKGLPAESLLWPTVEGNLMADDPRQVRLDLKSVTIEPARELKTVGA